MTLITIKLNIAKLYGKLFYDKDRKKRLNCVLSSLKFYEAVYANIKNSEFLNNSEPLKERFRICEEMIALLPVKIDKINNGMEI